MSAARAFSRWGAPHSDTAYQPMRMQPWYYHLIELMIASPMSSKQELAEACGVSFATVVYVTNSDLFRWNLEERRASLKDSTDAIIVQQLQAVALKGLRTIEEIIERKRDTIPLPQLVELSSSVLSKLGYGAPAAAGVQVNVAPQQNTMVAPVSAEDLAAARAALRAAEESRTLERIAGGRVATALDSPRAVGEAALPAPDRVVEAVPVPTAEEALRAADSEEE